MGKQQWIIWYAILLHWIWGATLVSTSIPLGVTAISTIVNIGLITGSSAGIFYLMVASLAALGTFAPRLVGALFLIPQTLVLWLAAYGAVQAMISGTFADGIVRPSSFLITDQAPAVLAAFFHSLAVARIIRQKEEPKPPIEFHPIIPTETTKATR